MVADAINSTESDIDTQEPTSRPDDIPSPEVGVVEPMDQVPESSDTNVKSIPPSNAGNPGSKLQQFMASIHAGDDLSDDDGSADQPVDFGDEEEEEEPENQKNIGSKQVAETPSSVDVTPTKEVDDKEGKNSSKSNEDDEIMDEDDDGSDLSDIEIIKPQKKVASKKGAAKKPVAKKASPKKPTVKKSTSSKTKEQQVAKKKQSTSGDKDLTPTKTIKKKASETKNKTKAIKPKSKISSAQASQESSPASSQVASKKKSAKQATGKMQPKSSKADGSPVKNVKAKKTIAKQEKSGKSIVKKTAVGDKKAKTFSKKDRVTPTKAARSKSTEAGDKSKAKAKSIKKKTPKKKKEVPDSDEDEVLVDASDKSEVEETTVGDEEDEDEITPSAVKAPIIGNLSCSSRDDNCQALLEHAVHQLGRYHVVSYDAASSWKLEAYVIGSKTTRGWGILRALALGIPLVSDEWLTASISAGQWQDINKYRSDKFGQAPRGSDGEIPTQTRLLEGLRLKIHCEGPDALSVRKVASICGARVAETRIDVIVNDTGKAIDGGVNVNKKWLADSIESGVSMEFEPYQIKV